MSATHSLTFLRNLQSALNGFDLDLRRKSICPLCGKPTAGLIPAGKTKRQAGLCTGRHPASAMVKPSGYIGLVLTRRNRIIPGAWVSLYKAEEARLDPSGGPWVTVCEAHGTLCNHRTKQLALSHLPWLNWCEECMSIQASSIEKELSHE